MSTVSRHGEIKNDDLDWFCATCKHPHPVPSLARECEQKHLKEVEQDTEP